jgi:predicted lipoprotein with Yx(FWY)xxD motif
MSRRKLDSRFGLLLVSSLVAGVAQMVGCSSNDGGIEMGDEGGASSGGRTGGGGSAAKGGTKAITGGSNGTGGSAGANAGEGGAGPEGGSGPEGGAPSPQGGTKSGTGGASSGGLATGSGGESGGAGASGPATGGVGGDGGTFGDGGIGGFGASDAGGTGPGAKSCVYFSPGGEVIDADGVGGASPKPTINVAKNAFAGPYLTDGAGKALYTYGADAPGDCNYVPVTTCFLDCAKSWPPFNGEPRLLGAGIDDSLLGSIQRTDTVVNPDQTTSQVVSTQTTYQGWPLYYYKNDAAPGDVKGQAVGKIWQLATVLPPNIVIIRVDTLRFVADENGHALYTSAADTKGTMTTHPVSACTGACLDDFEPFVLTYLSPVSYLLPSDFSYFVRGDGSPQIAYKGAPLYRSHADVRSAQTNGTAITGWSVAAP